MGHYCCCGQRTKEMTEWQPIETAPQDGTDVLLWDNGDIYVGSYIFTSLTNESVWITHFFDGSIKPTHWMPLPKPPISCVHTEWEIWLDTSTNEKYFLVDYSERTSFKYCPYCGIKAGDIYD